jgi:hypothetical protein
MYSIIRFDPAYKGGRLRIDNGMPDEESAIYHADRIVDPSVPYEIVLTEDLDLVDRTFRNAWIHDTSPSPVKIISDMPKARLIAHNLRRGMREVEFAPYDEIIMKQVPGTDSVAAEAARAGIRSKYEAMQTAIDAASNETALKTLLGL